MYLTNITKFVATIYENIPDQVKYLRDKISVIVGFTLLCGIVPGVVLKSYWLVMTILLAVVTITAGVVAYRITLKQLTLKRFLIADSILTVAWVFQFSIFQLMYFTMYYGFHISIIVYYIPVLITVVLVRQRVHTMLKKPEYGSGSGRIPTGNALLGGLIGVIVGKFLAGIIFSNVDQDTGVTIILICISMINCVMALGLVSVYQLYYMIKYDIPEPTK